MAMFPCSLKPPGVPHLNKHREREKIFTESKSTFPVAPDRISDLLLMIGNSFFLNINEIKQH